MTITLRERCEAIELLVLDVDGVLTAGGITYAGEGGEGKTFHVRDGAAIRLWQRGGKRAGLITGRVSPAVTRRAKELDLDPVRQGVARKTQAFREILEAAGLRPENACCIGDDVPDLPMLRLCGLSVAVADACAEVRNEAHLVTRLAGGCGVVREVVEIILRAQGRWQSVLDAFFQEMQ
ncbi:MAG TPA: HAD hydrolase family protein [Gemmataceae bacterium]|jgi:3-deoxy-D-manno-octulosonate 8-phosphate phosphatase (KDO 8-P phosphatase)|nr:HAD hydrolase family protein [Gemmataceae bacterium]